MPLPAVESLRRLLERSREIVFFGGAGMSTESGIPDFRSAHGLYQGAQGMRYEEMLSIGFFRSHPEAFWDFYRHVLLHPEARPNAGHIALARLERRGTLRAVITQNIDGLHQAAGSRKVLELHGAVRNNTCMACGRAYTLAEALARPGAAPRCDCGGLIRPDVVLYGEPLDNAVMDEAVGAVRACDLMLVGGTSLTVYPAAGLLRYRRGGTRLVLLNREPTPYDAEADLIVRESIAQALDGAVSDGLD